MGLLDRYVNNLTADEMGPYSLSDDDRKKLKRRGMLELGLQLLANPTGSGGVFQAFGKSALEASRSVQDGGQDLMKQKYQADQMKRYKADQDKQTMIDGLAAKHRRPDGTVEMQGFQSELDAIDPIGAMTRRGGNNAELETWRAMTANLSPEDRMKAERIRLKLDGGASSAAIKYMNVTNPDGSVSVRGFDANDPIVMNPAFGGGQPSQPPARTPPPFPARMSDDEVNRQATNMARMGMPDDKVTAWVIAQKSTPEMTYQPISNQASAPAYGNNFIPAGITPDEKVRREAQAKADVELATVADIEREKVTAAESAKYAAENANNAPAEQKQRDAAVFQLDTLTTAIKSLRGSKGLSSATGAGSYFPTLAGGDAADAETKLTTLKSKIALNVLQAIRDASKTGGALGGTSEYEIQLLENNLGSLDLRQSDGGFKDSLDAILAQVEAMKQNASRNYRQAPARPPTDMEKPANNYSNLWD